LKSKSSQWSKIVIALAVILMISACGKKKATAPPPPPPPPPPAPTASLTASPNTVNPGDATTLTWSTTNATEVTIDQIGSVDPSGSRQMMPSQSTTYRLIAKNPSGTQEATARVTVNAPPPPPTSQQGNQTEAQLFASSMQDVYFDYDAYDITQQYQRALQADAAFLKQHPNIKFTIEGHCDERGSTEYNLALGDNRANSTKQALISLGIPADRIRTISYGKEKPFCTESTEACWAQNRRAHFAYQGQ
jgi:peptidoglycan-associated lipoprotein